MSVLSPAILPAMSPSDTLRHAVAEGTRRARAGGGRVLVSVAECVSSVDPLRAFAAGTHLARERLYWEHGDHEGPRLAFAGLGAAHTIVASGATRFGEVSTVWRQLLQDALIVGPGDRWGVGPLLMGGFRFDPLGAHAPEWGGFPDAALTLSRFTLAVQGDECWLTSNVVLDPDDDEETESERVLRARAELLRLSARALDPAREREAERDAYTIEDALPAGAWEALVARTAGDIRERRFAKVVLARQTRVSVNARIGAAGVLARLRAAYPNSFLFAVAQPEDVASGDGERMFLGASPERLLRLHAGVVETTCLAGSTRRGATAEEDRQLGSALLASTKDRREHAVVADMLREALAPVCAELDIPEPPGLLRLANVQHLYTPIRGRLAVPANGEDLTILDLVERLHPTPAVGGFPRREALEAIREREGMDRGWYAGPIGWLDQRGEGEFAVAIRAALLNGGDRALLFAGCGIMGDSDPESEYAESRLKMCAMLSALTGS